LAARTLRLTDPYLSGPDVEAVQRALGVIVDGEYGPITAAAAADWKGEGRGSLTPAEQQRLLSSKPVKAVARMEAWAAAGVREHPPGSNRVPELVALALRLGVPDPAASMGFAWCGFAVFLAGLAAGLRSAELGLRRGAFNPLYCPSILAESEAWRSGLHVVAADEAVRGDLVLFDLARGGDPTDHVGRLRRRPSGVVETVDGNSGSGSLHVALNERPLSRVRAFVRER
jgi:hypothetical protein